MDVVAERLDIPAAYGNPTKILGWDVVEGRLAAAMHYWLATTRPDGRPHSVPIDGVWSEAEQRAAATRSKYGYGPPAATYREGVWCLRPTVVLAWTALHQDATRFRFR